MVERKIHQSLPGFLSEVAEAIGPDAALKIAEARGGRLTYFPGSVGRDHWLSKLLGYEAASALCKSFPIGQSINVPLGPFAEGAGRAARMDALDDMGLTTNQIAAILKVTDRTVRRRRATRQRQNPGLMLPAAKPGHPRKLEKGNNSC